MELTEAYAIFGFTPHKEFSKEDVKRVYRKLALKHHPDHGGKQETFQKISEANERILEHVKVQDAIKSLSAYSKERTAIISLRELIGLYDGNKILLADGYELSSGNLKSNRVYLEVEYSVLMNGIKFTKNQLVAYRVSDKYQVDCLIADGKPKEPREIVIEILDKRVELKLESQKTLVRVALPKAIYIDIQVERVEPHTD